MMWPAVVLAIALIVIAGVLVAIDAAISAFSKARAEELIKEGLSGAQRLVRSQEDSAPY